MYVLRTCLRCNLILFQVILPAPKVELGSTSTVVVSDDGDGPSHFHVQTTANSELAAEILGEIKPGKQTLTDPAVGKFCIAKYEDDWFRAKITDKTDDKVTVLFIDYGNSEEKALDQVFDLIGQPATVLESAQLCVSCRLDDCVPVADGWSEAVKTQFSELASEATEVSCQFVRADGDTYVVNLKQEEKCIAEKLITDGEAKKPETAATSSSDEPAEASKAEEQPAKEVTLSECVIELGATETVIVSDPGDKSGPDSFFLQTSANVEKANDMFEKIKPGTKQLTEPVVGKFCIAQYDGDWFRAKITKLADDKATVWFLDYGNWEEKPLEQLFDFGGQPSAVTDLPQLCASCRLDACAPVATEWSETVKKYFYQIYDDATEIKCQFVRRDGDTYLVNLKHEDKDIAQKLIDDGDGRKPEEPESAEPSAEETSEEAKPSADASTPNDSYETAATDQASESEQTEPADTTVKEDEEEFHELEKELLEADGEEKDPEMDAAEIEKLEKELEGVVE